MASVQNVVIQFYSRRKGKLLFASSITLLEYFYDMNSDEDDDFSKMKQAICKDESFREERNKVMKTKQSS